MPNREIKLGLVTYTRPDGLVTFGQLGDKVDVHADDVERFDRLNVLPDAPVAADAVVTIPTGDPSEEWTVEQLTAYAADRGIDIGKASTPAGVLAKINPA